MTRSPHRRESWIRWALTASGFASVFFVAMICAFLVKEGLPLFRSISFADYFGGRAWQPTLPPPQGPNFGLLPNLWGSLLVTAGAAALAVPLGLCTAIFMGKLAPRRLGSWIKAVVEMLGIVPSVAMGFVGAVVVTPILKDVFRLDTGKSALAGAVMLAFLAVPTIATIAEDAIASIPREYESASLALGATWWQTVSRVVVPAARPGILAAAMLGLGRAIGETMVVIMVTGNAGLLPDQGIWHAFTHSVRTITGTIGAEALEVATGEPHYHALFMLGLTLLAITLAFNLTAAWALGRSTRTVRP